jgi:two-component system NtrC family sensor kinase
MTGEKVLIIDDSSELRSLLESILPYGGYEATSASSGHEGLELISEVKPDVILIDLELPDTNGLQVLEELNRQGLSIPTVMMTGYGSEGIAARALRLGVQGYLIKPFTTEEVLSAIEKALSTGRLLREKEQLAALLDRYARHFKTLSGISRSMVMGLDLELFLQRIVEAGLFVTQGEKSALLLRDEELDQLQLVASQGQGSHCGGGFSSEAGDQRLSATLQQGAIVRIHAPPGATIELQTGESVKAIVQVPLKLQDQTIGLLSVVRQTRNTPFGKHDEQMLSLLADYAAMVLGRISQAAEHTGS